jgi:hypothetical protein
MTKQLSLFPESPQEIFNAAADETTIDGEISFNPVDEMFAACRRFRDRDHVVSLLHFISRFPGYSAFNGLMLFKQNPAATYVATARSWKQKFGRQLKFDARPLVILAPMAPILFVFDIQDTEGPDLATSLLKTHAPRYQTLDRIYENTRHNCAVHGIAVYETRPDRNTADAVNRISPALRKQYCNLKLAKDTRYLILIDESRSLADRYSLLAHALGHIFCGHLGIDRYAWWPERIDLNIFVESIEAAATAYLVCRRLDLQGAFEQPLADLIQNHLEWPAFSLNAVLQSVGYLEDMGKSRWKEPRKRRR